ncbi:MAG: ABC transporter substrate-binding protein [Oscillospiraceae bacterium]
MIKHRWLSALSLVLAFSLLLCSCSLFGREEESSSSEGEGESVAELPAEYPITVSGNVINGRPGKVVSLADSITEKIYDLGMEESLVGVSDYCDYPEEVSRLYRCGTALTPNVDAIADSMATMVISVIPLTDADTAALEAEGVQVVVLEAPRTLDALWQTYYDVGRILEGDTNGVRMSTEFVDNLKSWANSLQAAVQDAVNAPGEDGEPTGTKVAMYLRELDYTVATGDTLESAMLELIGLENFAKNQTDWTYPEEAANSEEGIAAFRSVEIAYYDERFVTIKDLEGSAFYKGLPSTLYDWYHYIDCIAFERQSLSMFEELLGMAEYAWPEANLPSWPYASHGAAETDPTDETDTGDTPDGEGQDAGDGEEVAVDE